LWKVWNTEERAKKEGGKWQDKELIARGGTAWNSDEGEKIEMEQRCQERGGNGNRDVRNWRRKLEQRCKELEEEIGTEM
jgi:hypothetical protein